jgi:hypothetical protein
LLLDGAGPRRLNLSRRYYNPVVFTAWRLAKINPKTLLSQGMLNGVLVDGQSISVGGLFNRAVFFFFILKDANVGSAESETDRDWSHLLRYHGAGFDSPVVERLIPSGHR